MSAKPVSKATEIPFPKKGLIADWNARPDFADAWTVDLPPGPEPDLAALTRLFFYSFPGWMGGLLALRTFLAGLVGLKTGRGIDYRAELAAFDASPGSRISLFELRGAAGNELMFGQDDAHLDFRLSLILTSPEPVPALIAATSVRFNNRLGPVYMGLVRPFHRLILKATLENMAATLSQTAPKDRGEK